MEGPLNTDPDFFHYEQKQTLWSANLYCFTLVKQTINIFQENATSVDEIQTPSNHETVDTENIRTCYKKPSQIIFPDEPNKIYDFKINDFERKEEIGKTDLSRVVKYQHLKTKRFVAIKFVMLQRERYILI